MNSEALEIVRRYLAGELDLESAAQSIHLSGEFAISYSRNDTAAEDQERIETLLGRVLWLSLRESSPNSVPDQPFGAAEFRAIAKDTFFDATEEAPSELDDSKVNGAT